MNFANRWVLRFALNFVSDEEVVREVGREFQRKGTKIVEHLSSSGCVVATGTCPTLDRHIRDVPSHGNDWPSRNLNKDEKNVVAELLVDLEDVLLQSLHIKLGLMKNSAKDTELVKDPAFDEVLKGQKKETWESFKGVICGFLGNRRDDNYIQLVTVFLQKCHQLRCNMSLKIHFLHSHLDFFSLYGAVSDKHRERSHQNISVMEKRYQGRLKEAMLADYCCLYVGMLQS
ncbi:hypothetical protein HELRODRAFT_168052 [Helobdella robusta]|uniref:Uncharacterized protein n=1 Tax=Helobdella robusta TaxID=6412 RepID=T1F040_HELRO|nr:hypothetical protein HELRODRAFT_168052 [Helobdella robusta]ESO10180.1 hypothetical protein HELRODRAFT_168052 [Helobdella robusta]